MTLIKGGVIVGSGGGDGTGDVVGPSSATDNAIVRFDATTGKLIQNSAITITDAGNLVLTGTIDGRDISVDGAKLDTIETSATVSLNPFLLMGG